MTAQETLFKFITNCRKSKELTEALRDEELRITDLDYQIEQFERLPLTGQISKTYLDRLIEKRNAAHDRSLILRRAYLLTELEIVTFEISTISSS